MKQYKLEFLEGTGEAVVAFEGTGAGIAQKYCELNDIKLVVDSDNEGRPCLYIDFSSIEFDTVGRFEIGRFERDTKIDAEAMFNLFFVNVLNAVKFPELRITEIH